MNAASIMTPEPWTIGPDATVAEAFRRLHDRDVRHLPVVADGVPLGMLSDRDLRGLFISDPLTAGLEVASDRYRTPVADIMSTDLHSVGPQAPLTELIDLMIGNKISAVLVVDERAGELTGIVSYVDIIEALRDAV